MKTLNLLVIVVAFMLLSACAQLPKTNISSQTYAFKDTSQTKIGKRAKQLRAANPTEDLVYLVNEGTDAFYSRLSLLAQAEKSIDVQYFIWHDDLIGKILFHGMLQAADRGVRVRILLDDINVNSDIEATLYALDQHKNIEVRLYNPFPTRGFRLADYITEPSRINRRMHNKSFTVDGEATIVGGRNIGNEYFSADEESNFMDIDVLSVGNIVNEVDKQFDVYWNSEIVYEVKAFDHNQATEQNLNDLRQTLEKFAKSKKDSKYAEDVRDSEMFKSISDTQYKPDPEKLYSGNVNVIYDDPTKGLGKSDKEIVYLKSLLNPYLERSKHTFELISPYFVPGETGTKYLTDLVKKGIKVRVITNSLSSTDGLMAQSGYSRRRIDLLRGGVELYELKALFKTKASRSLRRGAKAKSGLHAKTYIFDRENIFIGSFNFDPRSANINSEVGVVYEIPEMAGVIAKSVFDQSIKESTYKLELDIEIEDVDGIAVEVYKPVWVDEYVGKTVRHMKDPATSGWRRFNEAFFEMLPIESQL